MADKISGAGSPGASHAHGVTDTPTETPKPDSSTETTKPPSNEQDSWFGSSDENDSWTDFLGDTADSIKEKATGFLDDADKAVDDVRQVASELVDEAEATAKNIVANVADDVDSVVDRIDKGVDEAIADLKEATVVYGAALDAGIDVVEAHIKENVDQVTDFAENVAKGRLIDHTIGTGAQTLIQVRVGIDKLDDRPSFVAAESSEQLEAHFQRMQPGSVQTFRLSKGQKRDVGKTTDDASQADDKADAGESDGGKKISLGLHVDGSIELARPEGSPGTYELSYSLQGAAGLTSPYGLTGGVQRKTQVKLHFDNPQDAHRALEAMKDGATPGMLAERFPDALRSESVEDGLRMGASLGIPDIFPNPSDLPIIGEIAAQLPVLRDLEGASSDLTGGFGGTYLDGEGRQVVGDDVYRTATETHDIETNYTAGLLNTAEKVTIFLLGEDKVGPPEKRGYRGNGVSSVTKFTPDNAPADTLPTRMEVTTREFITSGEETFAFAEKTEYEDLATLADIIAPNLSHEELADQLASGFGYGGSRDEIAERIVQHNLAHDTDYAIDDFLTSTVEISRIGDKQDISGAEFVDKTSTSTLLRYTRYGDSSNDFATERFEEVMSDEFFQDPLPSFDNSRLEQQSGKLRDMFALRLKG